MVWSWQPGTDDSVHGFTVAAGRPVWVHVWRSLDTGAFDFDGEVLGMGGEMVPAGRRSDIWSCESAQEAAERAVARWADREDVRVAEHQRAQARWHEDHPEWGVAS